MDHAGKGDRARTAGQGRQSGPAYADFLGQHPGRAAGRGGRPHARRPHPVAPAIAGPQRPTADREDERDRGPGRLRRLHAPDGRPPRAGRRDRGPHHRGTGRPDAREDLSPRRHGGAAAADHPLFPRRWLGDGQPRGLRPGLPLFLRPHRLRRGRHRLSAGAGAQIPGRHRRRRRGLPLAGGVRGGARHRPGTHRDRGRLRRAAPSPPWPPNSCARRGGRPACSG